MAPIFLYLLCANTVVYPLCKNIFTKGTQSKMHKEHQETNTIFENFVKIT